MAFACAYMPFAALQLSIAVQMPRFMATTLGVGAVAGSIFGLVRMIDIPVDPALGLAMDRTRTPIGRYRPWLIMAAPVMMLAIYMLYQAPAGVGEGYLIGWLLVMYLGMSMLLVGGNAWASTLATSYGQRSRIFGAQTAMGVLGAALVLGIPIYADGQHLSEAQGIRMVGWFMMGLAPVAILIALARTPERITAEAHGIRFKAADYAALLTRPNVLRLIAADFAVTPRPGLDVGALPLLLRGLARLHPDPGEHPAGHLHPGGAGRRAGGGLARQPDHQAPGADGQHHRLFAVPDRGRHPAEGRLPADGADHVPRRRLRRRIHGEHPLDHRRHRRRDPAGRRPRPDGPAVRVTSATTKAATAVAVFLTFTVLGWVGYSFKAGVENGPAQVRGLELAYIIGPIVFVMIAGACFIGYRLNAARHAEIRRKLEERGRARRPRCGAARA
jgi:Na+/melibiose symporter-like transporter